MADFSTNAKPTGVWSYGWATSTGGQFQLMTTPISFNSGAAAGWWNNLGLPDSCYVDKDFSGSSFQDGTVVFDPDTLHMDPQSYAAIVRFTAPSNGSYQVAGLYRMQDTGTHAHNLSIILNTNITAYFVFTSGGQYGSQYPFSFSCTLNQGQTLDFIVSCNAGDYSYLGTGLKATVTPSANTPPLLQSPQLSGGNLSFSFLSMINQSYTIQATTNLDQPNWTDYGIATGNGSLLSVVVPIHLNIPKQFFRVSVP